MARRTDVLAIVVALAGCHRRAAAPATAIPPARGPITIDGEGEEPDWSNRALRGVFVGRDHDLARPASDIRLLRGDGRLFVGLYAADEDIRSTDAFSLAIGTLVLRLDATGAVSPTLPGVRVAVDRDGTLDDDRDDDEEWLLEIELPFAAAGLHAGAPVVVDASRCDTPKDGRERCGAWHGDLALD